MAVVEMAASSGTSKVYGSAMTIAPAAFIRSKSALTSVDSMFQIIRPGWGFLPWTSECGPTVTKPEPIFQAVYPPSPKAGSPRTRV